MCDSFSRDSDDGYMLHGSYNELLELDLAEELYEPIYYADTPSCLYEKAMEEQLLMQKQYPSKIEPSPETPALGSEWETPAQAVAAAESFDDALFGDGCDLDSIEDVVLDFPPGSAYIFGASDGHQELLRTIYDLAAVPETVASPPLVVSAVPEPVVSPLVVSNLNANIFSTTSSVQEFFAVHLTGGNVYSTIDKDLLPTPTAESGSLKAERPLKARARLQSSSVGTVEKDSDEYRLRRERNNVSVRQSREKARQKQKETEDRVRLLASENQRLADKVDSLSKELTILKGLFANVGASVPHEVSQYLAN